MYKLNCKRLDPRAKLPTVGHVREDLGYDLYALEETVIPYGKVVKVRTGIAAQARYAHRTDVKLGMKLFDRSSIAEAGVIILAGVIDAGYTGEIGVLMAYLNRIEYWPDGPMEPYEIQAGQKIAQAVPMEVMTGDIYEVEDFGECSRGEAGFGSTGR